MSRKQSLHRDKCRSLVLSRDPLVALERRSRLDCFEPAIVLQLSVVKGAVRTLHLLLILLSLSFEIVEIWVDPWPLCVAPDGAVYSSRHLTHLACDQKLREHWRCRPPYTHLAPFSCPPDLDMTSSKMIVAALTATVLLLGSATGVRFQVRVVERCISQCTRGPSICVRTIF